MIMSILIKNASYVLQNVEKFQEAAEGLQQRSYK